MGRRPSPKGKGLKKTKENSALLSLVHDPEKPARTWIAGWAPAFPRDKVDRVCAEIMRERDYRALAQQAPHPALALSTVSSLPASHVGRLQFFGDHARLADKAAFKAYLLRQRAVRRVQAGVAPSVALHPPHRDLQSPAAVRRPERHHLQLQGLSDRGARPLQDDDAGD
jgi:hypothetical protein